jgi:RES domain-containing protein
VKKKNKKKTKNSSKNRKPSTSKPRKAPSTPREFVLDQFSLAEMQKTKERTKAILEYDWLFYSEIAHQRKQIEDKLVETLIIASYSGFEFKGWQRAVKWKYGLHPFSTVGSLNDPGGRFNIGDFNPQNVPIFPALYLAKDKNTALQETLGQVQPSGSELSAQEIALTSNSSISIVSVNGYLEKVFDLRSAKKLTKFTNLIKSFKISSQLFRTAKTLELSEPSLVKKPSQLLELILDKNWRICPMQQDIPSASQIFGQLIYRAGVEGILYPSKLTGETCLAIFTKNFDHSPSYLELNDKPPHPKVPKRVDETNWKICDLSPDEVIL